MSKHKEIVFETEIVQHLANHEWVEGKSDGYDRALALYPDEYLLLTSKTLSQKPMRSLLNAMRQTRMCMSHSLLNFLVTKKFSMVSLN